MAVVAFAIVGSCWSEEKPFGPVHAYVAPLTVDAVRFSVLPAQRGLLLPAVGAAGTGLTVTDTVADEAPNGGCETVHLRRTGPVPPVWVNVAFGAEAPGAKAPVPPDSTLHRPVSPAPGVLPPRLDVVPPAQIV